MDKGQGVCPVVRSAHHHPDGRKLVVLQCRRLDLRPKAGSALSMIIANAMSERASGRSGQPNITVLDECWSLLDSAVLAPQVEQLFRTGRKRGASIWGISQALEDFVGTETQPRRHGPGIVKNVSTKIIG